MPPVGKWSGEQPQNTRPLKTDSALVPTPGLGGTPPKSTSAGRPATNRLIGAERSEKPLDPSSGREFDFSPASNITPPLYSAEGLHVTENTGASFARRQTRRNRRVVRISQPSRIAAAKRFIKSQSASTLAITVGVAFGVATLTVRGIIAPATLPQTSAAELAYSPALLRPALNPPDEGRIPDPSTYTVKEGDTLLGVALRFGSTVEAISLASNLSSRNLLQIGQVLTIPPAHSTLQTIEPGTTPAQLAASYGVDTAVFTAYNGIDATAEDPLDRSVVVLPPSRDAMSSGPLFASSKTPAIALDMPRSSGIYYVEAGETLFGIAYKLGVDPDMLARLNRLDDSDAIPAGRALNIPAWGTPSDSSEILVRAASLGSSSSAAPRLQPVVYEVEEGDTISTLADRFGVDTHTIVNNNELSSPDSISVGTQLTILPISGISYTVQPGDTLASIAERYRVDLGPIIDFNYLSDADNLSAGMELILPGASPLPPAPPPAPEVQRNTTYVVAPGDTVLTIAKRFGVEPVDIVVANKMSSADRLSIGQELKIVAGAGSSSSGNSATGSVSGPARAPVQQAVTRNLPVPGGSSQAQQVRPSSIGGGVVSIAMDYKGYRYVFGGTTPAGFDCSGFVYYVYNKAGSGISRGMWGQYNAGSHPSRGDLQPGDIVFFQNTYMAGLSHNGIYIGGGQFIHASDERTGVTISSLGESYWSAHWFGATRVN